MYYDNILALSQLNKPSAIIFDWDNTLVNSWPIIQKAIDSTMIAMNKQPWGLERVRNEVHKSMRESFPTIFGDEWQIAGEIYKKQYQNNSQNLSLLPLVLEMLETLKKNHILSFLVSNKIGTSLRKEVNNLNLEEFFIKVVGAQDAEFDKPYPHPAIMATAEIFNSEPNNNIWFIGDTIADIECAYYCGFQPILFTDDINKISKTIPEILLKSTNFSKDFLQFAQHQQFISPKIIKNNSNFHQKLPVINNYQDLISTINH